MKTLALLTALICASLLSACGAAGPIAIAPVVAAAVAQPALAAALAGPVLSDSAKVGCAIQAVANDLASQLPSAHPTAAAISKYAGLACTWL